MYKYFKFKNLKLDNIGFNSNIRIFINDNLTKLNSEIFRKASELKRLNKIAKIKIINGFVYFLPCDGNNFVKINNVHQLELL